MSRPRPDRKIDYIEFPAKNIPAAKRFYTKVFGWKFTDYGPDYTSFFDGRLAGGFTSHSKPKRGGALVVIYAKALEKIEKLVRAAKGRVVKKIYSFPGGRRFHFVDPSGNELAVWSDR